MELNEVQRSSQAQFGRQSHRYGKGHILQNVDDLREALKFLELPSRAQVLDVATGAGNTGLFFAALRGPGRVWLQTLPFSRLADRINAAQRGDREDVKRDLGGMLGGLGDLIGGDRA